MRFFGLWMKAGYTSTRDQTRSLDVLSPPVFSQQEIFALFGDCSRWDGMVERLIVYEDDDRTVVQEVRERFNRRKDKLKERRVYPLKVRLKERLLENMSVTSGRRDI